MAIRAAALATYEALVALEGSRQLLLVLPHCRKGIFVQSALMSFVDYLLSLPVRHS